MKDIFYFKVGRRFFTAYKENRDHKDIYILSAKTKYGRLRLKISKEDYNNIENKDIQTKVAKLWINAYV